MATDPPWRLDPYQNIVGVSWGGAEPVGVAIGSSIVFGDVIKSNTDLSFVVYSAAGALLAQYAFPQISGAFDGPITPWCNSVYRGADGTFAVSSPGYFLTQNDQPAFWASARIARFSAAGALMSTCALEEFGGSLLSVGMTSTGVVLGQDANNVDEQGVAAPPVGPPVSNDEHPKLFSVIRSSFNFIRYTADPANIYNYIRGFVFRSDDTFASVLQPDVDDFDTFTINRLDAGFNVVATSDLTFDSSDWWWLGNFSPDEADLWVVKNASLYRLDGLTLAIKGSFALPVDFMNLNSIDVHTTGDVLLCSYDQTVAVVDAATGTVKRTIDVSAALTDTGFVSQVAATGAGVTVATVIDNDNFIARVASYRIGDGVLAWQQTLAVNNLTLAIRKPKTPTPPPAP